jgi:hypothetical protein
LPTIKVSSKGEEEVKPEFDHDKGVFTYSSPLTSAKSASAELGSEKRILPGLFGAGIAFPEKIVDKKYGHEEYNVGFFKFMKAVRRWTKEEWVKV